MSKNFIVKLQKIGSVSEGNVYSFSSPLVVEPEDTAITNKKGLLYGVVDVSAAAQFDPQLVLKVALDTVQIEYFNALDETPLVSLEKAIINLRDKVFRLLEDPKSLTSVPVDFNATMAVLWGNVLYVVQYGKGCCYLIRQGRVKAISVMSEGNLAVASGVIKDSDIVALGSKGFSEKYSADNLLTATSSSVSSADVSAVILKFVEEKVEETEYKLVTIHPEVVAPVAASKFAFVYKYFDRKKVIVGATAILGLLLIGSVGYTYRNSKNKQMHTNATSVSSDLATNSIQNTNETSPDAAQVTIPSDIENKIKRVEEAPFYDLRIFDKEAKPSDITIIDASSVILADAATKRFYKTSFTSNPSISTFNFGDNGSVKYLNPTASGATFLGKDSFYQLASRDNKITKLTPIVNKPISEITAYSTYLSNNYFVHDGKIYKNNILWASDGNNLVEAVSMAVDGTIYVLTQKGQVLNYTTGKRTEFKIKNLDRDLKEPTQVFTLEDFKNIYVLDKGNKRVVVFDNAGEFKTQYISKTDSEYWNDLKSITVSKDEKTLLILAGTRIYKVAL